MPYAAGDTQALTPGFRIRNVQLDSNLLEFSITRPQVSALSTEEHAKAETFVRQALTAALKADELTKADRRRVVDLIKADFADAKNALKSHGLVASTYTNLQLRMDQAVRAVSSQTALGRGEPSLDEISTAWVRKYSRTITRATQRSWRGSMRRAVTHVFAPIC